MKWHLQACPSCLGFRRHYNELDSPLCERCGGKGIEWVLLPEPEIKIIVASNTRGDYEAE